MQFVAGVDAFGTVARKKIDVEFQAGTLFEHRNAIFFRRAGIHGRFVDDDIALLQGLADGLGRFNQRREIGALVLVYRRRHGDDEEVAIGEIGKFGREAQTVSFVQLFVADFQRRVATGFERFDAPRVDVKTNDRTFLTEFHGQRQADIAETDYRQFDFGEIIHGELFNSSAKREVLSIRQAIAVMMLVAP